MMSSLHMEKDLVLEGFRSDLLLIGHSARWAPPFPFGGWWVSPSSQ